MGKQKYFTEEERKEAHRIRSAKWRTKNPDYYKEYMKEWREQNPDYNKQYYQENKEEIAEYKKQWYQDNREKELERKKEYNKEYYNTPIGRAVKLVNNYKAVDKEANRGECTLTAKWIIDNIFPKPCRYCGVTGWEIIGCDRIDNDMPHTPDNVVPCCEECNVKRHTMDYKEFLMLSSCLK